MTARLASEAARGEILVSIEAAMAAGTDTSDLERRTVEVRGRTEPVEVVALRIAADPVEPPTSPLIVRDGDEG